jgi:hypothetical protein
MPVKLSLMDLSKNKSSNMEDASAIPYSSDILKDNDKKRKVKLKIKLKMK